MSRRHLAAVRSSQEELERLGKEIEKALRGLENTALELDSVGQVIQVLRNALDATPELPAPRSIYPVSEKTQQST